MPRNASGTYTLPNPPVVAGTTIDATDENDTRDDLAQALTDSLDRNGKGGMLAPFKIYDGSVGSPGLAFLSDTDSGAYRIGANNWALVAGGAVTATISTTALAALDGTVAAPGFAFKDDLDNGAYRIGANNWALVAGGVDAIRFNTVASGVNYLDVTPSATGNAPRLAVGGSDSIVNLSLRAKGTGGVILEDGNGNEVLIGGAGTASAVNEVTVTNAATGTRPRVGASGGDTDVGLALRPKGTGAGASVILEDGNGNEVLIADVATASAVNEVTITNAAAGGAPQIKASGGDTNIDLKLTPKGTGGLVLNGGLLDLSAVMAGQIKFPVTQNPSANANTLDDYEKGTWTPTITSGSGSFTSVSATGSYTKIGNLVSALVNITITTNGTAGTFTSYTLPFSTNDVAAGIGRVYAGGAGVAVVSNTDGGGTSTANFKDYNAAYIGASGMSLAVSINYRT